MPVPTNAIVIDAVNFEQLRQAIQAHVEAQVHRRDGDPSSLTVYLNAQMGPIARKPENGTALIAWMHAQGTREVRFRVDAKCMFLKPPQCAFVLAWEGRP